MTRMASGTKDSASVIATFHPMRHLPAALNDLRGVSSLGRRRKAVRVPRQAARSAPVVLRGRPALETHLSQGPASPPGTRWLSGARARSSGVVDGFASVCEDRRMARFEAEELASSDLAHVIGLFKKAFPKGAL